MRDHGIEPEIVEYFERPPSPDKLKRIIERLGIPVREIMRSGGAEYRALGLADESFGDEVLGEAICTQPKLLQRPIVVRGDRARFGRPPESIQESLP